MRYRSSICALVALAGLPSGARAESKARVCVLVEEQHDGARAQAGGGEAKLVEALLAKGYPLVERYDAEQARSKLSIDRMLKGETAGLEVTGLHADVLVVARLSVTSEQAPYGISYPVHQARIDLRALLVDTGRIFYANSAQAASPGDAGSAAEKVAQNALPGLLEALEKVPASDGMELRVAGLKDAHAADALAAALAKLHGVKSATVRYVSADATSIDVQAPESEQPKIEAALAAQHLGVARRSARMIEARLDESAVARRTVAVARFQNRTGRADLAWLEELLPDVFETELANSKYLSPALGGHPSIDADRPKTKGAGAEVVVVGKIEKAGDKLRLAAKALRAGDGAVLAAAQLFGTESAVAELGKELVWKLDPPLYLKLSGRSSLEGYVSPLAKHDSANLSSGSSSSAPGSSVATAPAVRIDDVKLADLFPSRIGYYARQPLGTLVLRNDGARAAEDVRVEVSLGELSGGPQTLRVGAIAPGHKLEVPLKLVLEAKALLAVTQRRPARADLAVLVGERRDAFTEPLVLWDRNAIDWTEPDSVAAFVTPHDPEVMAFAQEAAKLEGQLPPELPRAVRVAASIFDGLMALGVRYARDPLSPYGEHAIDTVQFPRETLARKAGDCDDLAVVYASLVQAIGQDAKLVLTPGHIFVAVDAELAAEHVERLGGAKRALVVDGHAWIPVEVTKVEGGFAAAWQAGLDEIGRYRGDGSDSKQLTLVDVQRAWRTFPPFPMEAPGVAPKVPQQEAKRLLVADARSLGKQVEPAAPTGPASTPEEALAQAVALAKRGEHDRARALLASLSDGPANPRPVRAAAANDLANLDALAKRYDDAIREYRSALDAGARSSSVRYNLGVTDYLAGHGRDARKELQQAGTPEAKKLLHQLGLAVAEKRPAKSVSQAAATGAEPAVVPAVADSADAAEGLRGAAGETRLDPADVLIWLK